MFKNLGLLSLQGSDAGLKTGLVPPVSAQGVGEDKDTLQTLGCQVGV